MEISRRVSRAAAGNSARSGFFRGFAPFHDVTGLNQDAFGCFSPLRCASQQELEFHAEVLNSSPIESSVMARASTSGSTEIRRTYEPIASASSLIDAHIRAKVRVSADSSSGGSDSGRAIVVNFLANKLLLVTSRPSRNRRDLSVWRTCRVRSNTLRSLVWRVCNGPNLRRAPGRQEVLEGNQERCLCCQRRGKWGTRKHHAPRSLETPAAQLRRLP